MNLETIRPMSDYHYWANDLLLKKVEALSPKQFRQEVGGSFPSLQKVYAHMLTVDALWLARLTGEQLPLTSEEEIPDAAAVRARWEPLEQKTRAFIAALADQELGRDISLVRKNGERLTLPLGGLLTHLFNHGTYHRGQISNLITQVGGTSVSTDFLFYLRELREEQEARG